MIDLKNKDCPTVYAHITMLQGIINRMANNSANCKTWTVTLIAAMLVLLTEKGIVFTNIWVCYVPVFLFYILDCYYLGLERCFIHIQNEFLKKVPDGNYVDDLFTVNKLCNNKGRFLYMINASLSISTCPFYGLIMLFLLILSLIA